MGYAIPSATGFASLLQNIQANVPGIENVVLSVHCHNDLGLAVANSLTAVETGARQLEGCINGIGERAGNASLEEIIMALDTRRDHFGVDIGIDTTQIYPSSRMVSRISGMPVQPNKAVVGENAFRHASGIHQDGVLKDRSTYEVMQPERVGVPGNSLVLGKLSGRAGLQARLEALGYSLSRDEVSRVFESFKVLADRKREVTDRDLEILMDEEAREANEPISYTLDQVQFSGGRPRHRHRHGAPDRSRGRPHHRRRHRQRPGQRHLQRHRPRHRRRQQARGLQRAGRHRGPRLAGHRHHQDREGRQDLHRPRGGHRHSGSQRQSLPQRRQPSTGLRTSPANVPSAGVNAGLGRSSSETTSDNFPATQQPGCFVKRPGYTIRI